MSNITHIKGNTFIRTLEFTDDLGAKIDLQGSEITFILKKCNKDETDVLNKLATIIDAINWLAEFNISDIEMDIPIWNYEYTMTLEDSLLTKTTFESWRFIITY